MSTHIAELTLQNFGPVKQGTLRLTPLHALIGPNDSGKSTVLRAMHLLGLVASGTSVPPEDASRASATTAISAFSEAGVMWGLKRTSTGFQEVAGWEGRRIDQRPGSSPKALYPEQLSPVLTPLRGLSLLRLDPDELRLPTPLLTDSEPLAFRNERGRGLGSLLDAIFSRSVSDYLELEKQLRVAFPTVAAFHLKTTTDGRTVGVKLVDGAQIGPETMSEGMLYFLAFSVLRLLKDTRLLLLEEPENGLHPSRIADVMKVLRSLSGHTQILLATHSPLVVNELKPEEVTVVTRSPEKGTVFTAIKDSPDFAVRSKVYALGELWLSYANGLDEAPLLRAGDGDSSENLPRG